MSASRTALVTGSSGLIGSEVAAFLDAREWRGHLSDLRGFRSDCRGWEVTLGLDTILAQLAGVQVGEPVR